MRITIDFGGKKTNQNPVISRAHGDGQFEEFRPSQKNKSPGLLSRIQNLYWRSEGTPGAGAMSEQGADWPLPRSTYPQSLIIQRQLAAREY